MKKKYKLYIFKDKRGEYRWHLRAGNGKIVADSAESYKTLRNVYRALEALDDFLGANMGLPEPVEKF